MDRKIHKIDAANERLGRMASKVATLLLGKHKPAFNRYQDIGDFVEIINAQKLVVTGKKMFSKNYFTHSNYPGGLKIKNYSEIFKKDPAKIIKIAVFSMLPKNKHRNAMMKRLKISK